METTTNTKSVDLDAINPLVAEDVRDTISRVCKVMDVLEFSHADKAVSREAQEGMGWLMNTLSAALRMHLAHGTRLPSDRLVFVEEAPATGPGPKLVGGAS